VCWLDLTLPSIEENLALDEALLLLAETGSLSPTLRFWEVDRPAVVLGMNSCLADEVNLGVCQRERVAVARRCSGGGTVVLAPGCLVFSLILPMTDGTALNARHSVTTVLSRIAESFQQRGIAVQLAGISDLVWQQRKVSGNSQRRLRRYFLHHGTLLYDFDIALVERYLPIPARQPEYRQNRPHREFLTNLPMTRGELLACVRRAFEAEHLFADHVPPASGSQLLAAVTDLVQNKYARPDWLRRR
jgi:lipoate-protein ligase A